MREQLNGLNFTQPTKIQRIQLQFQSQKHPFHILDVSPYPFLVSFFLLALLTPGILYMPGIEFIELTAMRDQMVLGFSSTLSGIAQVLWYSPCLTDQKKYMAAPPVLSSVPLPPQKRFAWRNALVESFVGLVVLGACYAIGFIPRMGPWLAVFVLAFYVEWRRTAYKAAMARTKAMIRSVQAAREAAQCAVSQLSCAIESSREAVVLIETRLKTAESKIKGLTSELSNARDATRAAHFVALLEVAEREVAALEEQVAAAKCAHQSLAEKLDPLLRHLADINAIKIDDPEP